LHELSFAENIVEIIHKSVPAEELEDVRIIRMKIGALSGIVADSLDFCFSAISAQTSLANARLEIENVPFSVQCNSCRKTFINDIGIVVCPECGGIDTNVVAGRELQLIEIELADEREKTS
jgi:hydrogenase nickel incorporation protein HypA/HybF